MYVVKFFGEEKSGYQLNGTNETVVKLEMF